MPETSPEMPPQPPEAPRPPLGLLTSSLDRATLVSSALEREVREMLRQYGIVVWLDKDALYSAFTDALATRQAQGDFPAPVARFRGSWLELMYTLEAHGSALDKQPLLIHLPGHNEQTVRRTPLLELYEAGFRYRRALDTLVREVASGRVPPDEIQAFLQAPGLTLGGADAWLAARLEREREGVDALLAQMNATLLVDELLGGGDFLRRKLSSAEDLRLLRGHLHRQVGLDEAWLGFMGVGTGQPSLEELSVALWGWLLCVEYVHDLRRPPHLAALKPLRQLAPPLVDTCRQLATHLRQRHAEAYARRAGEVEARIQEEQQHGTPEDLGLVDTFLFEEVRVLEAALEALAAGRWEKALEWARLRTADGSFWVSRDPSRRWEWTLVEESARLGRAIEAAERPLERAASLTEALEAYTARGARVDQAHRHFEQRRTALLESRLPHFGDLLQVMGRLRARYRAWADTLCRDFTRLCVEQGFLPEPSLRQRGLYEQAVHPLLESGEKVALFVIDAFRYELAQELAEELRGAGTQVELQARYAELPTLTAVGMNVLAPVAREGRLRVALKAERFDGFHTGEFTVRTPETRARAMGLRSHGEPALLLKLAEVCDSDTQQLKRRVAQAPGLVVVHGKEIDDAGEAGLGLSTFEHALRQLKAAWHHLQQAGVRQCVFTADHGFLLQDETTAVRGFGTKRDPDRRHVWVSEPRREGGLVAVSLEALGYEGASGHLLLPEDTAVFATGTVGASFVHGGNSPQERIIPVLRVRRQREPGASFVPFAVEAEGCNDLLGQRQLRLKVAHAQGEGSQGALALGFAGTATLDLALRVPERPNTLVTLKDVSGPASLPGGRIRAQVGAADWVHVFFSLQGSQDENVRVEVYHPDGSERVRPVLLERWFPVQGTAPATAPTPAPVQARVPALGWQEGVADEGARRVFGHIDQFGSVTEEELNTMLGGPRAVRRFALGFDTLAERLPFRVRIEVTPTGKRYVKEGAK